MNKKGLMNSTGSRWRDVSFRFVVFALPMVSILWSCLGCDSSDSSRSGTRDDRTIARGSVFGGEFVAGATVAFVPAFVAGSSDSLQPIEDLAAFADFQATTNRDGEFEIEIEAGRYFVCVIPPASDEVHLPGGNLVRRSVLLSEGSTSILNITLSERPPESATYVGSTTCLGCHPGYAGTTQTLHFLGFRRLSPAGSVPSAIQDLSRFPNADRGLDYFADGNPEDNTGAADGYGYRIPTTNGYSILLGVDGTGYFQALEADDRSRVSEPLYIEFTYGGEGLFKQRYVTRLDKDGAYTSVPADGSYYLLPGQYNETEGDFSRGAEVTEPLWVLYHPERWGAPAVDAGPVGLAPAFERSFDHDCAGCHFTGMQLDRDADGLFQASAVPDPGGPFDFDGDGLAEEMNVGCERCHGPGSAHVEAGRGYIVQPDYLAPGRANMICGQCHTRGAGSGEIGGLGGAGVPSRNDPETGDIEFVDAGISPAEFFGTPDGSGILPDFGSTGGFFEPVDLSSSSASWADRSGGHDSAFDHSRKHRQQYLDHARSRHATNPFDMVTCWDCHDSHGRERPAQASADVDNNVLCLRCHGGFGDWRDISQEMVDDIELGAPAADEVLYAIDEHMRFTVFDLVGVAMALGPGAYSNPAGAEALGRCTVCHMPKTAKSGSWISDDEGFVIRGDISSHTFDVISPRTSESMALTGLDPVPNSCVPCHRGVFRGAWPDYRYAK